MGYSNGVVSVDDRFARFGDKSFAINKINSVEVRTDIKKGGHAWIGWSIAAVLALTFAVFTPNRSFLILVAAVAAGLAWRSYGNRGDKATYRLFLVTSSSEAQAFVTNDPNEIGDLREAIEDAMSRSN